MSASVSGGQRHQWLAHVVVAPVALAHMWFISTTEYVTTAVQFISPLAVIVIGHLLWRMIAGGFARGIADAVLRKSGLTALMILAGVACAALFAPLPAEAGGAEEFFGPLLLVLFCLAIVAAVVFVFAWAVYLLARGATGLYRMVQKERKPPDSSANDIASLSFALGAIMLFSLEGVTEKLRFPVGDRAASEHMVRTDPRNVWKAAATATSPNFPLPSMLRTIPQPVKILVDEGLDVGARRVVLISGREGTGELSMRVVRKTESEVTFAVLSDTSPVSMWARAKSLTFRIEPIAGGSRLSVISEYDRLLAPAWFFKPFMGVAAHLAVDTLARDIGQRASRV
jgi:hypothetical protein